MFSHSRLVARRQAAGLSRSDLHRALVRSGLQRCRSLVDRWETGLSEPSASETALIADVLGVELTDLFDPSPRRSLAVPDNPNPASIQT